MTDRRSSSVIGTLRHVLRERRFYGAQTEALAATRAGDPKALPLVHLGESHRSFRGMSALWAGAADAAGSRLPEGAPVCCSVADGRVARQSSVETG